MDVDWQKRCLELGFSYVRASDDHWVECTKTQAIELLREVLGVDVVINDDPIKAEEPF